VSVHGAARLDGQAGGSQTADRNTADRNPSHRGILCNSVLPAIAPRLGDWGSGSAGSREIYEKRGRYTWKNVRRVETWFIVGFARALINVV
jgi:hypothetical protein